MTLSLVQVLQSIPQFQVFGVQLVIKPINIPIEFFDFLILFLDFHGITFRFVCLGLKKFVTLAQLFFSLVSFGLHFVHIVRKFGEISFDIFILKQDNVIIRPSALVRCHMGFPVEMDGKFGRLLIHILNFFLHFLFRFSI